MAKIAILATDGFEEAELIYPFYRLKEAGHESVLISLGKRPIEGKFGYIMKPSFKIDEISADEYDGVIIPGGTKNPDYLRRNQSVLDFVHKLNEQKKLVAAVCHAGWVLISSKVIKGRKATSYYAIKDDMINAGADFHDNSVIIDGNLITSRMPDDLPDFMTAVLSFLKK
ncbi:MAG: type 1 glutamine amidotransferase [Promethearchaeota archaeon]|nr:MAG: type 1 glutamine amidotransferase [Candidatus Lokiarchaeota archaeon]